MSTVEPHHFQGIYPLLGPGPRKCKVCRLSYDGGEHIEITILEPYTNYVCPAPDCGKSATWTGAYRPDMRTLRDHICAVCGTEFVKEDTETWQLSWEMSDGGPWKPIKAIRSKHAAEQQQRGLLELIERGELIRNVELVKVDVKVVPA